MKDLSNKIVIITGAGSGIGRAITMQLANIGATVILADINESGMQETVQICKPRKYGIYKLDVGNKEAIYKFKDEVLREFGHIDVLINNAGIIQPFVDVIHLEDEMIDRIMQINFYGTVHLTRAFLPILLKRPVSHIANVSSMGGFIPFPGQTIYGASKAAVKLFTEGLYAELKDTNVGVSIIHPGAINTNIMSNSGVSIATHANADQLEAAQKSMPADDAAKEIISTIQQKDFRTLVGKDAKFLDKFYRLAPQRSVDFITKQMSKVKH